jgi:DNA-binding CsgD family transcriptional regulator/tetratricopeptide (TPR) repeat protein
MGTANLDRAWMAFASGEWELARGEFEAAAQRDPSPEVIDGLGRTLWWLKDVTSAIEIRTTAYGAYRRAKEMEQAARIAVWLARELRTLFRNNAAADGWLARAETIASGLSASSIEGWIDLARAEASIQPSEAIRLCRSALEAARDRGDADLEIVSLARLAPVEVATGDVEEGVKHIDEAMAAATGREARDPQSVAEAYCALLETGDLLGDSERFAQWTNAISVQRDTHGLGPLESLMSSTAYGNLSAFCASCCGGMYLVTGKLDEAEDELQRAIAELEAAGMQSRCVHPVTQLAELRVLQGRYEEARALLQNYEDLPEAIRPLAVLDLALGDAESAALRLQQRVDELADATVGSLALHTVLVDAYVYLAQYDGAKRSVRVLENVAGATRSPRHEGEALFASGKLLAATRDARAPDVLRAAALKLSEASMALPACRARMELARTLANTNRPVAISEARASLAAFERLGAIPDADSAAAFLRDLGVKGRTGPKNLELLTKRETEVLRLVSQGFSNGEIAERLFISVKTAGHHVSNILSKLGLRSRTEAAAFASLHLPSQPVPK